MTPAYTAALAHYKTSSGWHGMPWEADEVVIDEAFRAGWIAHEQFAPVAQPVEQQFCKLPVPSSSLGGGSTITAEDIYAAYPRKVGKQAAIKAIKKALKLLAPPKHSVTQWHPEEVLIKKTQAYAAAVAQWPAADKQFIPHPATWFNRGSYDDDPKEWQRGAAVAPSQFSRKAH